VTRDHDVTQLSTAEPELTMRNLHTKLRLITPGSAAHVPILAHIRATGAELAGRGGNQQARGGQRHDSGILPGPFSARHPGDVDRDKEAR
jgi:hypothetical protein